MRFIENISYAENMHIKLYINWSIMWIGTYNIFSQKTLPPFIMVLDKKYRTPETTIIDVNLMTWVLWQFSSERILIFQLFIECFEIIIYIKTVRFFCHKYSYEQIMLKTGLIHISKIAHFKHMEIVGNYNLPEI